MDKSKKSGAGIACSELKLQFVSNIGDERGREIFVRIQLRLLLCWFPELVGGAFSSPPFLVNLFLLLFSFNPEYSFTCFLNPNLVSQERKTSLLHQPIIFAVSLKFIKTMHA